MFVKGYFEYGTMPRRLILTDFVFMIPPCKQAILFDFGGTLDSNGIHWPERFYSLYREEVTSLERDQFDRAFYDSDDHLHERHTLEGLNLEETVLLQCADTANSLGISKEISIRVAKKFALESRDSFRLHRPMLQRLSKRFGLGIVSNFYGNLQSILEREGLADLFGAVADSTVVGTIKPDPKIFAAAYEPLGVTAENCWMIGDSVARDMRGAADLGMRLGFMRGTRSPEALEGIEAICLDSLADLERAVEVASV